MARQSKAQIAEAAALVATQQAELKRMRAEKAARTRAANKAAKTMDNIEAERVAAHCTAAQPDPLHAGISSLLDDLVLPSPKRVLVGMILGLAASGTVGYGIGMLLSYAVAGIVTLTATAWIAFALTVLAWIVAIYAGWKVGGYVGGKVFASVVMPDGLASRSYESLANGASEAKASIGGWFSRTKVAVAAKVDEAQNVVTGAFIKPVKVAA